MPFCLQLDVDFYENALWIHFFIELCLPLFNHDWMLCLNQSAHAIHSFRQLQGQGSYWIRKTSLSVILICQSSHLPSVLKGPWREIPKEDQPEVKVPFTWECYDFFALVQKLLSVKVFLFNQHWGWKAGQDSDKICSWQGSIFVSRYRRNQFNDHIGTCVTFTEP